MPIIEKYPTNTAVIAAGWTNPTNAYTFNNTYAYSETDNAEQEYAGYDFSITGNEVIDKIYVSLKWTASVTTVIQGDAATFTGSIKVYDGSTWQTYQVTAGNFAVSTANDESLVSSTGDNSNNRIAIDVTSFLDTLAKINSAKTRLLFDIPTTAAGITLRWSVDCVSLIVCYHFEGGIMATPPRNMATTTQSLDPRVKKALLGVQKALSH